MIVSESYSIIPGQRYITYTTLHDVYNASDLSVFEIHTFQNKIEKLENKSLPFRWIHEEEEVEYKVQS